MGSALNWPPHEVVGVSCCCCIIVKKDVRRRTSAQWSSKWTYLNLILKSLLLLFYDRCFLPAVTQGYTIPLDKRLAADGRGLQTVHINENFAKLAEALYIADRKVGLL